MKDLLYKEFRLGIHPSTVFFLLFGAFLLIPSWPYFIAFSYIFIAFSNTFFLGRANQDVFFTASLPVRKRDVVRARVYTLAIYELLQVVAAIPFAILNAVIYPNGNVVGMNPNIAFFGFVLIMYAIFNIIFLTGYYKTAYKSGVPMLLAIAALIVYMAAVNVVILVVPALKTALDGVGADNLTTQLPVLAAGIVIYVLVTVLALRISEKRFKKVDL